MAGAWFVHGVLLLAVASCGSAGPTGRKLDRQVKVGALTRDYIVYVPDSARGRTNLPVVFMLPGTDGTGEEFYGRSGWRELADKEGFIAVFPTPAVHCYLVDKVVKGTFDDVQVLTKWSSGHLGDPTEMPLCTAAQVMQLPAATRSKIPQPLVDAPDKPADDVAFFDAMVEALKTAQSIDPKRMYITGFSSGGQMAGRLAAERSTVFASAASSAGQAWKSLPLATRPLTFFFTVGTKDDGFAGAFGAPEIPLTDVGTLQGYKNLVVDPLTRTQKLDSAAYTFQNPKIDQTQTALYTYATSTASPQLSNRFLVQLIDGLVHDYPNGKKHPVVMAELLWGQFKSLSLP